MWPFPSKRRHIARAKDAAHREKIEVSQNALLLAAQTTADAAHSVTTRLKQHLDDSIQQFETTIRILTDALIICTAEGGIEACNPAAEAMFASSSTALLHSPVTALFQLRGQTPDRDALWLAIDEDAHGVEADATLRGYRSCGESFPVDITMTRLDRSNGNVLFLMLVRDLSLDAQLRRVADLHQQRSRVLFDVSFDAILIVEGGRVVAANPAAGLLFGRDPESLLNNPFEMLVDSACRDVVSTIDDAPGTLEVVTTRHDGTPLQLLFSSTAIAWNDAEASLLTVKDVSEMKRLQRSMQTSRENGIDMIVCFGPDYRISFANEPFCGYYGATREQLVGSDIRALLSERERPTFMLNLSSLTPASPTRRLQIQLRRNGEDHLQDWIDYACYDASGALIEFQRSGRDITEVMRSVMSGR